MLLFAYVDVDNPDPVRDETPPNSTSYPSPIHWTQKHPPVVLFQWSRVPHFARRLPYAPSRARITNSSEPIVVGASSDSCSLDDDAQVTSLLELCSHADNAGI